MGTAPAASWTRYAVRASRLTPWFMTLRAFAGEPETLYVALDYAYVSGMTVTMVPDSADPDEHA